MFEFDFMRHAFLASAFIAVSCGVVGWFLVLRGQSFAGHALSHVGFTGATGAVLIGLSPLAGMLAITCVTAIFMGWEATSASRAAPPPDHARDSVTGLVLAASLGIGLLFLSWQVSPASSATSLLFGNLFGVDRALLTPLIAISIIGVAIMMLIARPLLHASLDPDLAMLQGAQKRWIAVIFMLNVALVTSVCAMMTGILLVFALLIGPAATILRLGFPPLRGVVTSAMLALILAWAGIALSWWTDAPPSFWISVGSALCYGLACLIMRRQT
ncbi:metal ABC transporter permease [Candidatus Kirkpatrickella diaphorinae]|uniref:High-affinity zinc uptake system membrane protein ZnuB n=1 Tax=Candidatus Kirkpatrickella diaphorinae TaxID=2984322 RepID=A0ABY6GHV3_9PROT|nr:metal ABC transporter permease [Candidatus Kirkpatrickella diaphorinae]UYH51000.1 metal ABC transporter permease [Candidatus Kirkpatrickella diaphorinae]